MLKYRIGRIALAAVLAMGVLSVGTTQSSAIDVMNGHLGPFRVIKDFVVATFEYGVWSVKSPKEGTVEHICETKGDYCGFAVSYSVFFDNCPVAQGDLDEGGMCGVGVEQPQGGIIIGPEGTQLFFCEPKSVVRATRNMLFVPDTCHDDEDS